jgi:ribonuclease T1
MPPVARIAARSSPRIEGDKMRIRTLLLTSLVAVVGVGGVAAASVTNANAAGGTPTTNVSTCTSHAPTPPPGATRAANRALCFAQVNHFPATRVTLRIQGTNDLWTGGQQFQNREGRLPHNPIRGTRHNYHEYDMFPRPSGQSRDANRIIVDLNNHNSRWLTTDHYKTFHKF